MTQAPVTHFEVLLNATGEVVRAFAAGFVLGRGLDPDALYVAEDRGVGGVPLAEKVARTLRIGTPATRFIATAEAKAALVAALRGRSSPVGVLAARRIRGAKFTFEFEVFSAVYARRILELFARPPEGVVLRGYRPVESVDPESRGQELYTPAHDYACRGEGVATGPLAGILALHQACRDTELVRESRIALVI